MVSILTEGLLVDIIHRDLRDVRVYHAVSLVGIKPYQH